MPAVGGLGKLAGLRIDGRNQRGIDRPASCRGNGIEPPRGSCEHPVVGVDDMGIAVGQRDRKVGIQVRDDLPGDEFVVPEVVRIEKADEWRVQLGQAASNGAGLARDST